MLYDLIATIVVGVGVAGTVIGINKLTGSRLPKWIVPACAGLGMLGYTIFNEYAWFPNAEKNLPDTIQVATKIEESKAYRPWTYIWPQVSRFIAISDPEPLDATHKSASIILVARWQNALEIPAVFDCANITRTDFPLGYPDDLNASLASTNWVKLTADDPVWAKVCTD